MQGGDYISRGAMFSPRALSLPYLGAGEGDAMKRGGRAVGSRERDEVNKLDQVNEAFASARGEKKNLRQGGGTGVVKEAPNRQPMRAGREERIGPRIITDNDTNGYRNFSKTE